MKHVAHGFTYFIASLVLLLFAGAGHAQEFTSNFTPSHGTDTYAFTLSSDSVVSLVSTLSGQVTAGDSGFSIQGADRSTDVVRTSYAHPGVTEGSWPLKAGTYYLTLYSVCGCTGSYRATLSVVPIKQSNDQEGNDTAATAQVLPMGTAVSGHLGFYNANTHDYSDFYALSLAAEGTLAVTTSQDATLNGAFGYYVLQSDASTVVRDTSVALPAGKYYVQVYTNNAFTYGAYSLRVNFTPAVPTPDPSPSRGSVVVQTAVTDARAVNPTIIFAPALAERNGSYQLYVAALYANQFYFLSLQNFQMRVVAYTGGELPVYQMANGADLYQDQPSGGFAAQTWTIGLGDLSSLPGLQLFAGFGRTGEDMLNRGQVAHVYTVP